MSVSVYSQLESPHLFGNMYINPATGAKSIKHVEGSTFESILAKETPPVKVDVPGIYLPIPLDENGKLDPNDPSVLRLLSSACMPDWFANVAYGGTAGNCPARDEYTTIVWDYFNEVKEEFGCDEKSYVPYLYGLPEYDKDIVEQMKTSLCEKVKNDPRAESLAKQLGALWPPERNTYETSTGIDKFF